jgi:hypothetical protein
VLTEPQIERLWTRKLEAEARALYFADIANRESTIKRYITGLSFVLGSAAIVTMMSHLPGWVPIVVTAIITIANGYQIAVNQESKIKTAGKLHLGWERLECEYDWLWSNTFGDDAEAKFRELQDRERDLSETAATEIGLNHPLWTKWWKQTCAKYASDYVNETKSTPTPSISPR